VPAIAFPKSLRIFGRDWKVRKMAKLLDEEGNEAVGLSHLEQQIIDVRTKQSSLDTVDTLVHEVFHAIRHCQGRESGGEVEEDYVRTLATGLVGVLSDNPQLATWLFSHFVVPPLPTK
jgi:hypothetical protein